jgi:hypothetical protein
MPGEGQEDARRVADRREFGDDLWSLAQRLAGEDNRLIVTAIVSPAMPGVFICSTSRRSAASLTPHVAAVETTACRPGSQQ